MSHYYDRRRCTRCPTFVCQSISQPIFCFNSTVCCRLFVFFQLMHYMFYNALLYVHSCDLSAAVSQLFLTCYQWLRNEFKSGRTHVRCKAPKKFFFAVPACPSTFFGSTSTISRFGERFRDGQYSLVTFLLAVLLLAVPPGAQPFVELGEVPRVLLCPIYGVGAGAFTKNCSPTLDPPQYRHEQQYFSQKCPLISVAHPIKRKQTKNCNH